MYDFFDIKVKKSKNSTEVFPEFKVANTETLMIRGGDFYAIWDEDAGLWTTDGLKAVSLIDAETRRYFNEQQETLGPNGLNAVPLFLVNSSNGMIDRWRRYVHKQMFDTYHNLDEKLVFLNSDISKKDYASHRLPYPLEPGECPCYDELISVLYSPEERRKLEWAIGSIVAGDSKKIQKFLVLYGSAGTGKSTVLNIIQMLFEGYYSVFDAKALGSSTDAFALEPFRNNPLVAIQHDGDLSRIEDNTRLNSLVSHETMTINEKFKSSYPMKIKDRKSVV